MKYEIIGTMASIIILIAFTLNGEKRIRIADLIGALVFIIYGIMIRSFSVIFLNTCLSIVQIYKLQRIK